MHFPGLGGFCDNAGDMRRFAAALLLILDACASNAGDDARGMSFEEYQLSRQLQDFADAGGDLNRPNAQGITPLCDALRRGYGRLARVLIARGAGVDAPEASGCTPLHVVVGRGDLETARFLLERGARANAVAGVVTPLALALARQDVALVKLLLRHRADPNVTPLEGLDRCGGTESAFGYPDPAHPNDSSKDRTMDFKALGWSWESVRPPLAIAVDQGNLELAGILLDAGARFRTGGWEREAPALFLAVGRGDAAMTALLLARGADPNERRRVLENKDSLTPLHVASARGNLKIVELLTTRGADVHAKTNDGLTPLGCAERGSIHDLEDVEEAPVVVVAGADQPVVKTREKREPDAAHQAVIRFLRSLGAK